MALKEDEHRAYAPIGIWHTLSLPFICKLQNNSLIHCVWFSGCDVGIHTSWLVTLFRRLSIHESALIRRWVVLTVLTLDYSHAAFLQRGGAEVMSTLMSQFCSICILML